MNFPANSLCIPVCIATLVCSSFCSLDLTVIFDMKFDQLITSFVCENLAATTVTELERTPLEGLVLEGLVSDF
ncbi:hypothetical protein M758_6G146600 [Ceratodon purpureus]|nr:hypothetical protein M758_6G146600 [Ceratodon purpureus]